MKNFIIKLKICWVLMTCTKCERIGQFLRNRLDMDNVFYMNDNTFLKNISKDKK